MCCIPHVSGIVWWRYHGHNLQEQPLLIQASMQSQKVHATVPQGQHRSVKITPTEQTDRTSPSTNLVSPKNYMKEQTRRYLVERKQGDNALSSGFTRNCCTVKSMEQGMGYNDH